jgi:cyanate permease
VLTATVTLLAHQGGWDETLMVLAPIAVFALLLALANRRANQMRARSQSQTEVPPAPAPMRATDDDGPATRD